MECPYCNKEMRAGYIATGGYGVAWVDNENNAENFWGMPNRVPLFKGGWASVARNVNICAQTDEHLF